MLNKMVLAVVVFLCLSATAKPIQKLEYNDTATVQYFNFENKNKDESDEAGCCSRSTSSTNQINVVSAVYKVDLNNWSNGTQDSTKGIGYQKTRNFYAKYVPTDVFP